MLEVVFKNHASTDELRIYFQLFSVLLAGIRQDIIFCVMPYWH